MYERVKTLRFLVFWIVSSRKLWVYIYNIIYKKQPLFLFSLDGVLSKLNNFFRVNSTT